MGRREIWVCVQNKGGEAEGLGGLDEVGLGGCGGINGEVGANGRAGGGGWPAYRGIEVCSSFS